MNSGNAAHTACKEGAKPILSCPLSRGRDSHAAQAAPGITRSGEDCTSQGS
jgi:hypothetical protein